MKRFEGSIMYLRNKESEQIRNKIEMRKLQEKLISVRFKHKSVRQFEKLIEEDRKITNTFYPRAAEALAVADDDDETIVGEELRYTNTQSLNAVANKPDNSADADRRPADDSKKNNAASSEDDDTDDVPLSIDFDVIGSAKSEEQRDSTENDTSRNKPLESRAMGMEFREQNSGIDEDECFAEAEFETGVSETIAHGDDDNITMEDFTREEQLSETSACRRLTVFEAFGVARVLEKWIDWIDDWDRTDSVTADDNDQFRSSFGVENCKKMRAFASETLGLTVRELRSSNTFTVLQRANETMLKEMRDEREMETELASNWNKLNDLRNGNNKRKQQHNTEKLLVETKTRCLAAEFERTTRLIELENEYLRAWENQWLTENKELLNEEEIRLRNEMDAIDYSIMLEQNYMVEAKQTYSHYIDNLNEFIQTWETIYNRSVGAIDIDILTLEQEQEDLDDMHRAWQSNFDQLQSSIDELERRKGERDERARLKMYMNDMAVRIQAFWRGMMVRRFLGPYKRLRKRFKKKSATKPKPKKSKK